MMTVVGVWVEARGKKGHKKGFFSFSMTLFGRKSHRRGGWKDEKMTASVIKAFLNASGG